MIDWKTISLEHLAGFISDELRKRGVETILVGGACVTIYSNNQYQSYDLDFIVYEDMKKVKKTLKELGFHEEGKHFCHQDCKWLIEFVSPPVAVGHEIISDFQDTEVATGIIKMLRVEDSVKDRLASYFHWNDRQGLNQALEICKERQVDLNEVENWATQEGFDKKFQEFIRLLKQQN
jgi:predicted nucleotidyltransferase